MMSMLYYFTLRDKSTPKIIKNCTEKLREKTLAEGHNLGEAARVLLISWGKIQNTFFLDNKTN